MYLKRFLLLSLSLLLFTAVGYSQDLVTWSYSAKKVAEGEVELTFKALIDPAYHMYAIEKVEDGPMPLEFAFIPSADYQLVGKITSNPAPKEEYDKEFGKNVKYYSKSATFTQRIKVKGDKPFSIKGSLSYQVCGEDTCIPGEEDYSFSITADMLPKKEEKAAATTAAPQIKAPEQPAVTEPSVSEKASVASDSAVTATADKATWTAVQPVVVEEKASEAANDSVLGFILLAIAAGLGAVFTPCVFPMIPMTVSFFISGSGNRFTTILKAIIFCVSVALIYSIIGIIVAIFKSPEIANVISSHYIPNLIFAFMFLIFAASFFGMFEITLPSGIANKADRQVDKGGYVASFFMALVLAIVSFSCTGPFVGSLLPLAAEGTSVVKPILGLFFFGLAMSSPFLLLAIFPSLMEKMPKSGGWLNSIKVVFAFIMLAFCVKFIAQAGLSLNITLITRTVAIGIWIALAILLGMYLLGKLKFSHDSDMPYVSVPRFGLALGSFVFAIYLFPGLFGADLELVSAFLPPKDESVLDLTQQQSSVAGGIAKVELEAPCGGKPAYSDTKMHFPAGITGYFDVNEAFACAKEKNKPIILDFKGFSCANCKKMEASAFKDPRVIELISKEFIMVGLYNDENAELPESEKGISAKGKPITTLGQRNNDYQLRKFNTIARPYFAVVDADDTIIEQGLGYADADELLEFLNKALVSFNAKKK